MHMKKRCIKEATCGCEMAMKILYKSKCKVQAIIVGCKIEVICSRKKKEG